MKKLQKLMAVGATLGLGATIISPAALAANIELTASSFSNAADCVNDANSVPILEAGKVCKTNIDSYWLGDGEYIINDNISLYKSINLKSGKLTINNGTFAPDDGADSIYLYGTANLEVNGGTIGGTNNFSGITADSDWQTNTPWTGSLTINGGTIKGGSLAIAISYANGLENRVTLKGGVLSATNPGNYKNAFAIMGSSDSSIFNKFLANGYHYTNDTKYEDTQNDMTSLGGTSTSIEANATTPTTPTGGSKTVNEGEAVAKISDNKKAAMEEMSREMEKVIASATSKGSTKKTTTTKTTVPKTPDTGVAR